MSNLVTGFFLFTLLLGQTPAHGQRKKMTVGEMLEQLPSGKGPGQNLKINKTFTVLPATQPITEAPKPVAAVKPPSSTELFRDPGTDEEALEQVTDQAIQELYKLTQQYKTSKNRGELWLRLAEAYVEKAKFIEYRLQRLFDEKLRDYNEGKGKKPKFDLSQSREYNVKAIKLYEWFLNDFPKDPKVDQALFFLGYNHIELDQVQKGIGFYTRLTKEHPTSPYVSEAQFALGEYYFDNNKWKEAEKYYRDVLKNRRARLFTFALYKVGWCQYRQGKASEGLKTLEQVVSLSRNRGQEGAPLGRRVVSRIRLGSEALKDIVLYFGDVGNHRTAKEYFARVGGEKAVYPMLEKLAYYYSDSGKAEEAMYVFKQLLEANPTGPKAFDHQYQIVQNYASSKEQGIYKRELYSWIDNFGPDSAWARANRGNQQLLDDAMALRESSLRNYTLLLHKNAQNSQKRGDLLVAKEAYQLYLSRFPESPNNTEMHFFFGELLYSLNDFKNAGTEYQLVADRDPNGKYYEQATLNALLSLEKGLKTDQQIKNLVGDSIEPVPFGEAESAFVAAADRYTKATSKSEKRVDVRFKVGRLHYGFNHFDEALKIFKDIVDQYPRTPYAVYSANLILDIYNLRKDYNAIATVGGELMRNRALTEQGFETDIKDVVEKANFKKALDREVAKDYEGSAKAFSEFFRLYPKSTLASSAAFNAAVNFERAGKIPEAILFYKRTDATAGPKEQKVRKKTLMLLGRLYEQTAQYEKAAVQYERYANEYKDALAGDLHYNAAVLWEGQRSYDRAIKNYQQYNKVSKKKDRNVALFTIAQLYEKQNALAQAKATYEQFLASGAQDPEKVVEAQFKIGWIMELKGSPAESEKHYRRTVAVYKGFADQGKTGGVRFAAEAKFKLVNKTYQDFVSIRIPADPQKQAQAVQEKLSYLGKLGTQLAEVIKYDDGNMVIASLTKLGAAYEHLRSAILRAPVPADLRGQELQEYRAGVEGLAKNQEQQAINNFKSAVAKSYEINFYNEWTTQALKALERLDPQNYPTPKETVIPVWSPDSAGINS